MIKRKQIAASHDETNHDISDTNGIQRAKKPKLGISTSAGNTTVKKNDNPRPNTFPFLKLPAELRILIYEHALINEGLVKLHKIQTHSLRAVQQAKAQSPLVPALLRVNKQICQEAIEVLYMKNHFHFTESLSIGVFLGRVSLPNFQRLRSIRLPDMYWLIRSWDSKETCLSFTILALASGVNTLHMEADNAYVEEPHRAAKRLWRVMFPWFHAIGIAKGRRDAGIQVLKIEYQTTPRQPVLPTSQVQDAHKLFKEKLRVLLDGEQKRIQTKPDQPKPEKTKTEVQCMDAEDITML